MLAKNARASVAMVTVALITGLVVALLVVLTPAPAQAQAGDVVRLLSIKAVDITDDEGGIFGDFVDEPYIKVDGNEVWSGRSDPLRMKNGDVRDLTGVSATLSGGSARVQLWESDPGFFNRPDDGPAEFFAEFTTAGDEKTRTVTLNGGVYEITYVVDRPPPDPAPDTVIISGPSGIVNDRSATFEFFANAPGSTFECSLDGATFEPCSSPKVYSNLSAGDHAFEVRARNANGADDTPARRSWTVNAAPVARADRYVVNEDKILRGASVLRNDSDANGDTLTARLVRGTSKGQLTLRANGTFTYKPRANFFGTDSFTYRATDGKANSNTVRVTINVKAQPK